MCAGSSDLAVHTIRVESVWEQGHEQEMRKMQRLSSDKRSTTSNNEIRNTKEEACTRPLQCSLVARCIRWFTLHSLVRVCISVSIQKVKSWTIGQVDRRTLAIPSRLSSSLVQARGTRLVACGKLSLSISPNAVPHTRSTTSSQRRA